MSGYDANGQGYVFFKEGDALGLWKHNGGLAVFSREEQVPTPNTNVVLAFSLTSSGQNLVLTGTVVAGPRLRAARLPADDDPPKWPDGILPSGAGAVIRSAINRRIESPSP